MCIEVYSPNGPLVLPYSSEAIAFSRGDRFRAVHALLIENGARIPVNELNAIYPRPLYGEIPDAGPDEVVDIPLEHVSIFTTDLPLHIRGIHQTAAHELTLDHPNPNQPEFRRKLVGDWIPGDEEIAGLATGPLDLDAVRLIKHTTYSFFQIRLSTPIQPQERRWIGIEFNIEAKGSPSVSTRLGNVFIHKLASPFDVHHTFQEHLAVLHRQSEFDGHAWVRDIVAKIQHDLGLLSPRSVDTQYYELMVRPGPTSKQLLMNWLAERDIRMRSTSPRLGVPAHGEDENELIYEWKSGSLLEPHSNPWRDRGFVVHLQLLA